MPSSVNIFFNTYKYIFYIAYNIYIYIYIYIFSKYLLEQTTTCDNQFRISTFQVTSNNIIDHFCRDILLSFPTKYQITLTLLSFPTEYQITLTIYLMK